MKALKSRHTAQPWTIGDGYVWHTDEATGCGFRFKPIEFNGGCLAWVADDEGDPECEANTALIAAAPDLLAALARIADGNVMSGDYSHAETVAAYQQIASTAIAKLRGEA